MKRILLIIFANIIGCVVLNATQLTSAQVNAKKEIYTVLKNYGTDVFDGGEESIFFKYNESTYAASVHILNPQTLYLCLSVIYSLPEDYNSEIANIAAYNAAGNKPVCSFSKNGIVAFSCEMYAKQAKPFIEVLPEMLNALGNSIGKFQEEYDKASKEYITSSLATNVVANNSNHNEYIYPKVSSNRDSKLYIEKVILDSNSTILHMVSYNGNQYQNCAISKNSYIVTNGTRYPLIRAEGISYLPQYTEYPNYESGHEVSLHFKLIFPAIPQSTSIFDFSEGDDNGWQINGVELTHGNVYVINGESIETTDHKWTCCTIEVQDTQTIVTKKVQPKSSGTYMYSSQDEYIEDADTGRKYYLQNSSIGFESSALISQDTKTITFYEVYPVLPSTVKRINISSSSQYYVKNMKIR